MVCWSQLYLLVEANCGISSQLHLPYSHIGSLKLAIVGKFSLQKLETMTMKTSLHGELVDKHLPAHHWFENY